MGTRTHPTRLFHEPEEIVKIFEEYKADLERQSQEWQKVQYVGKDGLRKSDGQKVPMTMEGFYIYCRKHYGCVRQYFNNYGEVYGNFIEVCAHIKEEVRNNQIIGGMMGFYNPSITQRLNGLTEKVEESGSKEVTIKVKYERKGSDTQPTAPGTGEDIG